MGSKIFILLGLSIAFALLISSEVAARDLAETTTEGASLDGCFHGGCGRPGGGGGGGRGGGGGGHCKGVIQCGRSAAEAQALEAAQVKPRN